MHTLNRFHPREGGKGHGGAGGFGLADPCDADGEHSLTLYLPICLSTSSFPAAPVRSRPLSAPRPALMSDHHAAIST